MTPVTQPGTSVSLSLERHRSLRTRQPCCTLLVGPVGLGMREWRNWFLGIRRATVLATIPTISALLNPWVTELARSVDLTRAAVEWLAGQSGRSPEEVQARLRAMSHFDLGRWFANLGLDPRADPASRIVHRMATLRIEQPTPPMNRLSAELIALFPADEPDSASNLLKGLGAFVPEPGWPTLLFPSGTEPDPKGLVDAARCCEQLTRLLPSLPVAVCCGAAAAERTLRVPNPRRELAWLREGWIDVPGLSVDQLRRRVGDSVPLAALDRLAREGASEALAESLAFACQAIAAPSGEEAERRARSSAERFLYEWLESMPETAGEFRLNAPLDFRHGPQRAEADLASPRLRLVIELDGGYYHLNPTSYRRDRRKDWEYQRRGYWVLRFLSEDVIGEMEAMLNRILEAVRERRAGMPTTGRDEA